MNICKYIKESYNSSFWMYVVKYNDKELFLEQPLYFSLLQAKYCGSMNRYPRPGEIDQYTLPENIILVTVILGWYSLISPSIRGCIWCNWNIPQGVLCHFHYRVSSVEIHWYKRYNMCKRKFKKNIEDWQHIQFDITTKYWHRQNSFQVLRSNNHQ